MAQANITKGAVFVFLGAVLISFSAIFVRVSGVGPDLGAFVRLGIGGIALALYVLIFKSWVWHRSQLWLVLASAAFCADLFVWHRSITLVGPGLATVLGNLQVLFVPVLGAYFLKEGLEPRLYWGGMLALLGLLPFTLLAEKPGDAHMIGVGFGITTALFYASYIVILRFCQTKILGLGDEQKMAIIGISGALLFLPIVLTADSNSTNHLLALALPTSNWWALSAYGLLCQAGGWLLLLWGLRDVSAALGSVIILTQPILSFIWDILFFARPTNLAEATGGALLWFGMYLAVRAPKSNTSKK